MKPECSAGRRVAQWAHDCVPGFAAGVTAEQDDLVEQRATTVYFLPKSGILAVIHTVRKRVPDNGALFLMRSLCIKAVRKVRGWEKDISRISAIPPNDVSLSDW